MLTREGSGLPHPGLLQLDIRTGCFGTTEPELVDPEKTIVDSSSSLYLTDKDEALQLVGLERAETFTEEQYRRVRRKLVSSKFHFV